MFDAKIVLKNGTEALIGLSGSAMAEARKLSIAREVILQAIKMAGEKIFESNDKKDVFFFIEREKNVPINFQEDQDNKIIDFSGRNDLNWVKVLRPLIEKGEWEKVQREFEIRLQTFIPVRKWKKIQAELIHPQGNLARLLKEAVLKNEKFYIVAGLMYGECHIPYIDVFSITKDYLCNKEDKIIRLAECA